MNPWIIYPVWQNFSSMYREAVAASGSRTGMERAHHSTAAVYFGVAALEAFLNEHMRAHLKPSKGPDEIYEVLRKGNFKDKLKKWPKEILGKTIPVDARTMELLLNFNDVRNDLTHPKDHGHDVYLELEAIDPRTIVKTVAEYIVRFHEEAGTTYPYWVFGWNYLNPRPESYDIFLINEQQFMHSMCSLGIVKEPPFEASWRRYLGSFAGYLELHEKLQELDKCEPKKPRFPHAPVLCRLWWKEEHQQSCGCVTREAVQRAIDIDRAYGGTPSARDKSIWSGIVSTVKSYLPW